MKIIIFGYNEYVKEIAKNFKMAGTDVLVYVLSDKDYKTAYEDGYTCEMVELDDDWKEIAEEFKIEELICFNALEDDAKNVFLTISLRAEYPDLNIIALASSNDSAQKLKLAGATKSVAKLESTANLIVETLEKPAVVKVLDSIFYHTDEVRIAEYTVSESSVLNGMKIDDVTIHEEYNLVILAIADRELDVEFSFTTQGYNHAIDVNDVLVVIGKEKDLEMFEKEIR